MCLITFAYETHSKYRLIVVANRDEFYERPTRTAQWWETEPELLAGKDLKGNGTWLGIHKSGRFAALTNYRDGFSEKKNAPSRGDLVKDFLLESTSTAKYLNQIATLADDYNGYNLIAFDGGKLGYFSNQIEQPKILEKGIYGLSNSTLDVPWPKVKKATAGLTNLIEQDAFSVDAAFGMMQNKAIAADENLPSTNIPLHWERQLSAMCIETPDYGTRCSTVFLLDYEGNFSFEERSYVPQDKVLFEGQF